MATDTAQTAELIPPRDFDAEQATLGSMLLEPGATERAFAIVGPDDFYWEDHQDICRAMVACRERGEPVDLVTVSGELRRVGKLEQIGGGTYLTALISGIPTAAHVIRYAHMVAEKSVLRQMAQQGAAITREAMENPDDVGAAITNAEERFQALITSRMQRGMLRPITDDLASAMDGMTARINSTGDVVSSARFGIGRLDDAMMGLEIERVVTLMAETKDGKSQLTKQVMIETARRFRDDKSGRQVAMFMLEEGDVPWWCNVVSYLSGIDSRVLKNRGRFQNYLKQNDWAEQAYWDAWAELATLPLFFDCRCKDVRQIGTMCRALSRNEPLGLIAIDYMQKLKGFEEKGRTEEFEFRARAEYLDDLTMELEVPCLVPSQITERADLKRRMAKGAKAIEEKSSIVLEWRRDKAQSLPQESGFMSSLFSRNGSYFAPIEIITQMNCGRFYDAEDWRRTQHLEHQESRQS